MKKSKLSEIQVITMLNEGEAGFGVDLDNYSEEELHQFLTRILKNYSTISKRCIDIARTFKWPMIASQYNEIYNRI